MEAIPTIRKSTNTIKRLIFSFLFINQLFSVASYGQVNDDCANATTLVSGAAAICSQTTSGSTIQTLENVLALTTGASADFTRSIWYKFTATAAKMFVEIKLTTNPSCATRMAAVVYNSSGCLPTALTIISTQQYDSDGYMVLNLTGLTIGNSYKIQVGYNAGSGCTHPTFCIKVGNTPAGGTCTTLNTTGCGYVSAPTVAQVVASCPVYNLTPVGDGGSASTYCYDFTAVNPMVSFSMIITSTCGASNVATFSWTLQSASCGANVASGTLASLTANNLVIGNRYILCYTYTIPVGCYHLSLYPYFVGASPLPVTLTSFTGEETNFGFNLHWEAQSEVMVDHYRLERSNDVQNWTVVGNIASSNSTSGASYSYEDQMVPEELVYYRLISVDTDGQETEFNEFTISHDNRYTAKKGVVRYYDLNGRLIDLNKSFVGIAVKTITLPDGTVSSTKVIQ